MTTANTIISDALAEIGVIGAAEEAQSEHLEFCLRKLNQLVQRLSNSRLAFPALVNVLVALTGAASYTVGPGGVAVAARPIRISNATATDAAGLETGVRLLTQAEWDGIVQKSLTGGRPDCIWYEATNTNGTVHVYPRASGYTLKIDCQVLLASFPNLVTQLLLPEGYETWLTLMLADDVATAFGKQTSPDTRRRMAAAAAGVRAVNAEPQYLDVGLGQRMFNIRRGY